MTVEEFAARFNQEFDWSKEILDTEHFRIHPFLASKFREYLPEYKITPGTCEYSTAEIYEDGVGTDKHNFELQIYSYKDYHQMYFWIHPDLNEQEYKEFRIKPITDEARKLIADLTVEREELDKKLKELNELIGLFKNKNVQ